MVSKTDDLAGDVTRLLNALQPDEASGVDTGDRDEVFARVYGALHRIARHHRSRWRGNETLNTTALVHEAYLKLVSSGASYESRSHFLATASSAMRQLLINYAQRHAAQKRGSGNEALPLDDVLLVSPQRSEELLALDEALDRLQLMDPRAAQVVECRVFGGLSAEDTAEALGVTRRTVSRDWSAARAWLYGELRADLTGHAA
ncbi:ECF-type sigma factor [Lysobacter sp. H23M47]|uniref:ECF-type sigma factor n=1 Tax=Lysobacter sp. H23M47 TaxID=2781024 RepID=UPI00188171FF|nr:ECF-type sigma factor [Lysobacter sp. H23M47]QOW25500.1 sigma-70 family RNA polymerase sigma factor [Lysobacter sp. H23M47]